MDELNCSEPMLFTKGNTRTRGDIRVNAVCADTIRTPLVDNLFVKFAEENHCSIEDYRRKENALYMRGSAGQPKEGPRWSTSSHRMPRASAQAPTTWWTAIS